MGWRLPAGGHRGEADSGREETSERQSVPAAGQKQQKEHAVRGGGWRGVCLLLRWGACCLPSASCGSPPSHPLQTLGAACKHSAHSCSHIRCVPRATSHRALSLDAALVNRTLLIGCRRRCLCRSSSISSSRSPAIPRGSSGHYIPVAAAATVRAAIGTLISGQSDALLNSRWRQRQRDGGHSERGALGRRLSLTLPCDSSC
jgi:hypothetical protein